MLNAQKNTMRNLPNALRITPWLLLVCVIIFVGVLLIFEFKAVKKESAAAIILTKEKGASLIHAFETTLLSSSAWTNVEIDQILQTQANRNDIYFMAITDKNGKVLAASQDNLLNKVILKETSNTQPPHLVYGEVRKNLTINLENKENQENEPLYLIHKQLFAQDPSLKRFNRHRHNAREPRMIMRDNPHKFKNKLMRNQKFRSSLKSCPVRSLLESGELGYMVIGFDVENIMSAIRADDKRSQIQMIALTVLILLGIFASFILRAYQRSYRMAQESKAYILALVDALPLGIITLDTTQNIITMNPYAEKIINISEEECAKKHIGEIIPPLTKENFSKNLHNVTMTLGKKTTEKTLAEISSFPIVSEATGGGHAIIIRDLQEIQKLQAELHKHEHLASIGKLAAGIAHEIRNPLSSIKGLARLFEETAGKGTEDARLAGIMSQEVMRVDKVVSDLLSFSKPDSISVQKISMHELFEKAKNSVLPESTKHNVTFVENIDDACKDAVLDDDRMMQVLQNLFLNAIQAMPKGGSIELRCQLVLDKLIHSNINDNVSNSDKYLEISVCDTGKGIAQNQLKNLFTPYFTDKAKGTGLGLVMVQKIVAAHNGEIFIESEENVRTCVIMRFPQ